MSPTPKESSTGSETSLALADRWLQDYLSNHAYCDRISKTKKLPTRLLELGQPLSGQVRLCNTTDLKSEIKYMTLSHCWGSAPFLKLTSETSQEFFRGMSVSRLARTFQDAIKIAQRLGSQFLWIDSLCIFQDSNEDWHHESLAMSNVYSGSVCNIAAAGSSNRNGRCFRERSLLSVTPCLISTHYGNRRNQQYLMTAHFDKHLSQSEPFFRRGWVVQERYLSPRVLYFGRKYITWECGHLTASESYPKGIPKFLSGTRVKAAMAYQMEVMELAWYWNKVIQDYSECALTEADDKLIAISGIAKSFKNLGGREDYFAGMWRRFILSQLLWLQYPQDLQPRGRASVYRAPSWSWASMDGSIDFELPRCNGDMLCILKDVKADTLTEDRFGKVKSASICIAGSLKLLSYNNQDCSPTGRMRLHGIRLQDNFFLHAWDGEGQAYWDIEYSSIDNLNRLHFLPFNSTQSMVQGLLLLPTMKI